MRSKRCPTRLDLHLEGIVRRKPGLDKAPPVAYVMLAVADTGIGIDAGDLNRIFEPFYSTKTQDGKTGKDGPSGSGLGLSVSAGIVKDLDGWIERERRQTGGTIFRGLFTGTRARRTAGQRAAQQTTCPPTAEPIDRGQRGQFV